MNYTLRPRRASFRTRRVYDNALSGRGWLRFHLHESILNQTYMGKRTVPTHREHREHNTSTRQIEYGHIWKTNRNKVVVGVLYCVTVTAHFENLYTCCVSVSNFHIYMCCVCVWCVLGRKKGPQSPQYNIYTPANSGRPQNVGDGPSCVM